MFSIVFSLLRVFFFFYFVSLRRIAKNQNGANLVKCYTIAICFSSKNWRAVSDKCSNVFSSFCVRRRSVYYKVLLCTRLRSLLGAYKSCCNNLCWYGCRTKFVRLISHERSHVIYSTTRLLWRVFFFLFRRIHTFFPLNFYRTGN